MNAVVEEVQADPNEKLREVFKYGIENNKSEDEIKMAMIKEGATFKNVTRLFNQFAIDSGLIMKKEEKDALVQDACQGQDLTDEETLNIIVDGLVDKITGAEESAVLRMVRAWAKKNDQEVFKKAKGGGGTRQSGFRYKFYEALKANPRMDSEYAANLINSEGSKNDIRNLTHYQGIRELINAIAG